MAEIRSKIGNDLLLTPAAGIALFNPDGLLLARHVHDERWAIPGGGVEPLEPPLVAARREVLEEVGIDVEDAELIGAYGGESFTVVYPGGAAVSYVVIMFAAVIAGSAIRLQLDEVTEASWFSESEVSTLNIPPDMSEIIPDAFEWHRRRAAAAHPNHGSGARTSVV